MASTFGVKPTYLTAITSGQDASLKGSKVEPFGTGEAGRYLGRMLVCWTEIKDAQLGWMMD